MELGDRPGTDARSNVTPGGLGGVWPAATDFRRAERAGGPLQSHGAGDDTQLAMDSTAAGRGKRPVPMVFGTESTTLGTAVTRRV